MICMQVFFPPFYYHIYIYQLNHSTELRTVLVLPPIVGTDKISLSYLKLYFLRMERFTINLRFWTRISDLILPSLLKQYVLAHIYIYVLCIYWQVAKGLPWFASSAVIANIGFNMSIGATITHVLLWYGKDIIKNIRNYQVSFFIFSLEGSTTDWCDFLYT